MKNSYPVALGLNHFVQEYMADPEIAAAGAYAPTIIANRLALHGMQGVGQMLKSLDVTGIKGQGGVTGGDALKVEDLLSTVTQATLSAQNFAPFWNSVNKKPAKSDLVENTRVDKLGNVAGLGFLDPSTLTGGGTDNNPDLRRADQRIKWFGKPYSTTLPAKLVTAQGLEGQPSPGNTESVNSYTALNGLIIDLDYQCFWGNAGVTTLEANGIIQQVRSAHSASVQTRYDCNGEPLNQKHLTNIRHIMYSNGAIPTDLWWSPNTLAAMERSLLPQGRMGVGTETDALIVIERLLVQKFGGETGHMRVHRDKHLDPQLPTANFPAQGSEPPATPTLVTGSATAFGANEYNALGKRLLANSYYYFVCSVSIKGRSTVVPLTASGSQASVTVNGTQKANVIITKPSNDVVRFEVFRGTTPYAQDAKPVGEVTASGVAAGATVTFVDSGEKIPGTSTAVMLRDEKLPDGESLIMVRQLLPITRFSLPIYAFNHPAIWLCGMTPQVRAPQFNIVIENIGTDV